MKTHLSELRRNGLKHFSSVLSELSTSPSTHNHDLPNSEHKAVLTSLSVYALLVRLVSHYASQSALKLLGSAFSLR